MPFQVPKSRASIKQNRFEFVIAGKTYSVPLLQYLAGNTIETVVELTEAGGVHVAAANYALFGPATSPAGKAVRTLDADQLKALIGAWQEASSVTVGESEAS